jgi:S-DNA-T family DNA segregation ATPase FtsK/SpoIIIE
LRKCAQVFSHCGGSVVEYKKVANSFATGESPRPRGEAARGGHHMRRRYLTDLLALFLLAGWLAAILAVASFDPRDPNRPLAYPVHAQAQNFLGAPGATAAALGYLMFGWSLLPFLGCWYVAAMALLWERRSGSWVPRLLGWQLLVPGAALLADLMEWPLNARWQPLTGSGGRIGASLHDFAGASLAAEWLTLGSFLVTAAGALLALNWCWPWVRWMIQRVWQQRQMLAQGLASLQAQPMKLAALARPAQPDSIPIRHPAEPRAKDHEKKISAEETAEEVVVPTLTLKSFFPAKKELKVNAQPAQNSGGTGEVWVQQGEYKLPPLEVLEDPAPLPYHQPEHEQRLRDRAAKLEQIFADFGLTVRVVGINTGPVITQFEIALETGLRLSRVTSLADDLALKLKVSAVRVVAPLPNKDTVGIEIPNDHRAVVKLKEVILAAGPKLQKYKIPLFLGRDTEGQPLVYDLAEMPHLLIAGRTGTGKSVCMNTIVLSMLMTRRPDQVRMIMIDPKMLEMSEYGKVPHLMHPVVNNMKKAEAILSWAVDKMDERYEILMRARVRSIAAYNELPPEEIYKRVKPADDDEKARIPERMPYIVLFIDEFADLMMQNRKEVEGHIIRLAQKSRAAGIHLVIATQKPTVDVVTGLIKSNLPARICFQVASRTDSRVVLDEMGAEKLLGKGDMLFLQPGTSTMVRGQGTFASDQDIAQVVSYLETDQPAYARELIQLKTAGAKRGSEVDPDADLMTRLRERDELYPEAVELVIREQRGSVSLLQRALGIGYGRGARLIDFMAEDGFVGPYNGSNAREVLLKSDQWEAMKAGEEAVSA